MPGATPASPGAAPMAPAGTPSAAAPAQPVDVEAVLTDMASRNPQKLNWQSSIVDLMKLLDLDSSLSARKELAEELGYGGAKDGSAEMNIWLHRQVMRKLAENGGRVPDSLKGVAAGQAGACGTSTTSGAWPRWRRKRSRSPGRIAVVMALVSGWKFTHSNASISPRSKTGRTAPGAALTRPKGGDGTGLDAELRPQRPGLREAHLRRGDGTGERVDGDAPVLLQHREDERALALRRPEEEVLGVAARQVGAERLALLHREDRRVGNGARLDPERGEAGEQAFGRFHAGGHSRACAGL
jgi:hypothetical protein